MVRDLRARLLTEVAAKQDAWKLVREANGEVRKLEVRVALWKARALAAEKRERQLIRERERVTA